MSDDASPLVWAESKGLLVEQAAAASAVRTRAVALLSVVILVGGFYASRAATSTRHVHPNLELAALATFGSAALIAVWIQLPRDWYYGAGLTPYIKSMEEDGLVLPITFYFNSTRDLQLGYENNLDTLDNLHLLFAALCGLVGAAVVLLGLAAAL